MLHHHWPGSTKQFNYSISTALLNCSMLQHSLATQTAKLTVADRQKSKFLTGLMGGIGLCRPQATALSLGPTAAAALHLPKPQMRPLPPLPHVPSIAEFQRTISGPRIPAITAPLEIPRLEVLPLLSVTPPQVSPLHTAHSPLGSLPPTAGKAVYHAP